MDAGLYEGRAWARFYKAKPDARLRLFCFPYAGGGASIFRTWGSRLPASIDVCPIQLPGREERIRERAYTQVEPLCEALTAAIEPLLDLPSALFGHSMGAIVAYEMARRLSAHGRTPAHLIVSGQRAPHRPLARPISYDLPEPEFRDRLRTLNGTPEAVLNEPELMTLILPLLRSDFELSETYLRADREPLDCPVSALGGADDAEVIPGDLEAWCETTTRAFVVRMFPGDHFYVHSAADALLATIAEWLLESPTSTRPT